MRAFVDDAKAIAMHKLGRPVSHIADHFGVKRNSVYRAFARAGYGAYAPDSPVRIAMDKRRLEVANDPTVTRLPPTWPRYNQTDEVKPIRDFEAEQRALNARRVDRDPCPRCGCRGDFGCHHRRQRLGWSVG